MESLDNLWMDSMDRELDGALGKDLEKQAEKVLQNQIEASQVQFKNEINTKDVSGLLAVEQVKAQTARTRTDTEYYAAANVADSKYYQLNYQLIKEAADQIEYSTFVSQHEPKEQINPQNLPPKTSVSLEFLMFVS